MHRREVSYHSRAAKKLNDVRLLLYNTNDYSQTDDYKAKLKSICYSAMEKLDSKCRKIIIAYYIDRLTMKEIATYMNLSSGDVAKTLKSRCYKKLISLIKNTSL